MLTTAADTCHGLSTCVGRISQLLAEECLDLEMHIVNSTLQYGIRPGQETYFMQYVQNGSIGNAELGEG